MAKITTKTARRNLSPRNEPYWRIVSSGRAVGYRRGVKGVGTWHARLTLPGKKLIRQRLGLADDLPDADPVSTLDYSAAEEKAREWFDAQGVNDTTNGRMTVGVAMEEYVAKLEVENPDSTAYVVSSAIKKHILPTLKDVVLTDLVAKDIRKWHVGLISKGLRKSTANRILTNLKAGLNLAFKNEHIKTNQAWSSVEAFRKAENPRKIFFTKKQVETFLKVARKRDEDFADIIEANFYAGTRPGAFELSALRVQDVDVDNAMIEILESKTGERSVVVPKVGFAVFARRVKGKRPKDLVFTRRLGGAWSSLTMSMLFREVLATTDLPAGAVPYTLRHSHISLALVNGLNIQLLALNCGTSTKLIESVYGKFIQSDKRRLIDEAF